MLPASGESSTIIADLAVNRSDDDHDRENSPNPATSNIEEIVQCILRGLLLAKEMKTSVKNIEDLLSYVKNLYCKGDHNVEEFWPSNWRETEKLRKEVGY